MNAYDQCAVEPDVCWLSTPGLYAIRGADGDRILVCPAGSDANADKDGCAPCPAGTYALEGTGCLPCDAGRYGVSSNQTACLACPVGAYSTPYSVACTPCPLGTASAIEGAAQCMPCQAGTYAEVEGLSICAPCAAGTFGGNATGRMVACVDKCDAYEGLYSAPGAIECVYCAGGLSNGSECLGCGLGFYEELSHGMRVCQRCPDGLAQISTAFATSPVQCLPCDGAAFASLGGAACVDAALGWEPVRNLSTGAATRQAECAAGTFRGLEEYQCTACPPGSFSAKGARACAFCAPGKYRSDVHKGDVCVPCPSRTYAPEAGASMCDTCPDGTQSRNGTACPSCVAGKYAAAGMDACMLCPMRFTAPPGAAACVPCPAWTRPISGGICGVCEAGSYMSPMVSTEGTITYGCVACGQGTFNPSAGATDSAACKGPCAPLSYVPNAALSATGCAPGPPGTFSVDGRTSQPCGPGNYSALGLGCSPCPMGTYSAAAGASRCEPCFAGSFSGTQGAVQCTPCPYGTATGDAGRTACDPCGPDGFMSGTGALACAPRRTACAVGNIVVVHASDPTRDNECEACLGCDPNEYAIVITPGMSTWDTMTIVTSLGGTPVQAPPEACPGNTTSRGYVCRENAWDAGYYLSAQDVAGASVEADLSYIQVRGCDQLTPKAGDTAERIAGFARMAFVVGPTFACYVGCRYGLNVSAVSEYIRVGAGGSESPWSNVFYASAALAGYQLCLPCSTAVCPLTGRYRPFAPGSSTCGAECLLNDGRQCQEAADGRFNDGCTGNCTSLPDHAVYTGGSSVMNDPTRCPFACLGPTQNGLPGYHLSDDGTRCEPCGVCADSQHVPVGPCDVYNRTSEVCRPCPMIEGGVPTAWLGGGGGASRCAYDCQYGYYASEDATLCMPCTALNAMPCPVGTFRDVATCNYARKPPQCAQCSRPSNLSAEMVTFQSAGVPVDQDRCMALCSAGFHTLTANRYVAENTTTLSVWDMDCRPCGYQDPVPCHGACASNQYRDPGIALDTTPGACKACLRSAECPTGFYAPRCHGNGTRNVECLPCDPSRLLEPNGQRTRVFVPYDALLRNPHAAVHTSMVDEYACPTACDVNRVVDPSDRVTCVQCPPISDCGASSVPGQPTPCDFRYAHWNASDGPMWWLQSATPSFLRGASAGVRAGVCWACPTGMGTPPGGADLCQLLPGFSLLEDQAMQTVRVPIPTLGEDLVISLQEPRPPVPTWFAGRRRLMTVDARPLGGSGMALVPVGYYNDGSSVYASTCPDGTSTRSQGGESVAACECIPGHYNASGSLLGGCVPCPSNTFRNMLMPPDGCAPCGKMETTFGHTGQSACACAAGWRRGAQACEPCDVNTFCAPCFMGQADCPSSGVWSVPCMPGGIAPRGSTSLLNCTCRGQARLLRPGVTIASITQMSVPTNAGMYCLSPPPNSVYDAETLTLRCKTGWTAVYVSDVAPPTLQGCALCGQGSYATVDPAGGATPKDCRPCPLGTFMDRTDAIGGCISCGNNLTTVAQGAKSASDCACPLGARRDAVSKRCVGCALGQYPTPDREGCVACPEGTTSLVGARNSSDCVCNPGAWQIPNAGGCAPCPVGTFATHAGMAACTPCGPHRTTSGEGATTLSACFCMPGFTTISGVLCTNATLLQ